MVNLILAGLLAMLILSPCAAFGRDKGQSYTIRDRSYRTEGYVKDGTIYDRNDKIKGYIKDDKIYDRNYRVKGYLEPEKTNKKKTKENK